MPVTGGRVNDIIPHLDGRSHIIPCTGSQLAQGIASHTPERIIRIDEKGVPLPGSYRLHAGADLNRPQPVSPRAISQLTVLVIPHSEQHVIIPPDYETVPGTGRHTLHLHQAQDRNGTVDVCAIPKLSVEVVSHRPHR